MVKREQHLQKRSTRVILDPVDRDAREHRWEGFDEQVTIPDLSPSLSSMVMTGVVGSMSSAASSRYSFTHAAETESDDDHEMPDYQRLKDEDMVIREQFVEDFNKSLSKKDEKVEGEKTGEDSTGASGESGGEGSK